MNLRKLIDFENSKYQVTVARAVLNFWRADEETRAKLLDSYESILKDVDE